MGRESTFKGKNALDDLFDEMEEGSIESDKLDATSSEVDNEEENNSDSKTEVDVDTETGEILSTEAETEAPVVPVNPTPKPSIRSNRKKVPALDFSKNKVKSEPRTFRLSPELDQAITEMVTDSRGKRIKGSKGFLKSFVNNALIKEMIYIGVLDESYSNKLTSYDE